MPDQLDQAKELEQLHRQAAIDAALTSRSSDKPVILDGKYYCIDCMEEIPEARIRVNNNAARCIKCQEQSEVS